MQGETEIKKVFWLVCVISIMQCFHVYHHIDFVFYIYNIQGDPNPIIEKMIQVNACMKIAWNWVYFLIGTYLAQIVKYILHCQHSRPDEMSSAYDDGNSTSYSHHFTGHESQPLKMNQSLSKSLNEYVLLLQNNEESVSSEITG